MMKTFTVALVSSAHHLTNTLKTIDANSPPWSVRYPHFLSGILDDPAQPAANNLHGNAIVRAVKPYEVSKPAVVDSTQNPVIAGIAGLTVEGSLQKGSAVLKQVPGIGVIKLQEIGLRWISIECGFRVRTRPDALWTQEVAAIRFRPGSAGV